MASAIFVVPILNSSPDLPMDQLYYDNAGELAGGYSCIGQTPSATTCLVRVYSSEEKLDTLAENPNYLFVEDVAEPQAAENPPARELPLMATDEQWDEWLKNTEASIERPVSAPKADAKRTKKTKAQKITWLKGKGHNASKVNDDMAGDELTGLHKLHGVSDSEYEAGKR